MPMCVCVCEQGRYAIRLKVEYDVFICNIFLIRQTKSSIGIVRNYSNLHDQFQSKYRCSCNLNITNMYVLLFLSWFLEFSNTKYLNLL